jgi:hypothetical protein
MNAPARQVLLVLMLVLGVVGCNGDVVLMLGDAAPPPSDASAEVAPTVDSAPDNGGMMASDASDATAPAEDAPLVDPDGAAAADGGDQ